MSDPIERQEALDAINSYFVNPPEYMRAYADRLLHAVKEDLVDDINNLPTIEPMRKKGKWVSADAIFGGVPFYCSECGENTRDTVMGKPRWNFCPNCGADMRGEEE